LIFLFQGILSLAPTSVPRFKHGLDSFVAILIDYSFGISILVEILAARM